MQLPDLCLSLRCMLLLHPAHPLCLPRWMAVCLPHDEPWAKLCSPGPHSSLGKGAPALPCPGGKLQALSQTSREAEILTSNFGLLDIW